tara:strand:- start:589 stop:1044 length:456 start_codon:yes stop_codon:yes gene_type:complete
MGVTLTSKTISSTYKGLLKLSDNDSLNTVYKTVTDGFGNDSALKVSSIAVSAVKLYSEMDTIDISGDANGSVVVTRDYINSLPSTTGDVNYVHDQGVPSSTWSITHNLNKLASVTVVDTAGSVVVGDVSYTDVNNLTVTFNASFSGEAYIN